MKKFIFLAIFLTAFVIVESKPDVTQCFFSDASSPWNKFDNTSVLCSMSISICGLNFDKDQNKTTEQTCVMAYPEDRVDEWFCREDGQIWFYCNSTLCNKSPLVEDLHPILVKNCHSVVYKYEVIEKSGGMSALFIGLLLVFVVGLCCCYCCRKVDDSY